MDASGLRMALESHGFSLRLEHGKLLCSGPSKVPPGIAQAIRDNRDELVRMLSESEGAGQFQPASGDRALDPVAAAALLRASVPFAEDTSRCYCCGGTCWWRLHEGCPWTCPRCHPPARAEVEWRGAQPGLAPGVVRDA